MTGSRGFAHFYDRKLDAPRTEDDVELIRSLVPIGRGTRVLDAGCGYGRVSWALAATGAHVTGVDIDPELVRQARDAGSGESPSAPVFVTGDLHHFAPPAPVDVVLSWYSSFGFDDDEANLALLRRFFAWTRPGGVLVLDLVSRDHLVRNYREWLVIERGPDTLVDHNEFDPVTGTSHIHRRTYIGGSMTDATMAMRAYTYSELRPLLEGCGFTGVSARGGDGRPLTLDSSRMVIRCTRPG